VFAETGLLIGFFLLGRLAAVTAGLLAATGAEHLYLNGLLIVAAVVGDKARYAIVRPLGPRVFTRESRCSSTGPVERTRRFYEKYGGQDHRDRTLVPIVRTLRHRGRRRSDGVQAVRFYNVAGGVGWVVTMTGAGLPFLGTVANIGSYTTFVVPIVIVLSLYSDRGRVVAGRRRRFR